MGKRELDRLVSYDDQEGLGPLRSEEIETLLTAFLKGRGDRGAHENEMRQLIAKMSETLTESTILAACLAGKFIPDVLDGGLTFRLAPDLVEKSPATVVVSPSTAAKKHPHPPGVMGRPREITDETREQIRTEYAAGGISHRALAVTFGVSSSAVAQIVKGMVNRVNAKVREETVIAMREDYAAGGVSTKVLGERNGIAPSTANAIVHGDTWKDAPGPIAPPRFPLPDQTVCDACGRQVSASLIRYGTKTCLRCYGKQIGTVGQTPCMNHVPGVE